MDGRVFDDAARAIGRGASRRRLLAGLVGSALGVGSFGRAVRRAGAQESGGGEPCGNAVCGAGEFCCNASCSRCAPLGGACTQEDCGDLGGERCGGAVCGAGEFCCNPSCSICAPIGGVCTDQFCGDPVCPPGETCCDAACTACCPEPPPDDCRTAADCPPDPTGCNEVGCAEGRCVSTLRACDPAACVGEGATCGSGTICCDGLVCDEGDPTRRCRAASPGPAPAPPTPPIPDPRPAAPPGLVRALPQTGAAAMSAPAGWWSWPAAWTAVAAATATLAARLAR